MGNLYVLIVKNYDGIAVHSGSDDAFCDRRSFAANGIYPTRRSVSFVYPIKRRRNHSQKRKESSGSIVALFFLINLQ